MAAEFGALDRVESLGQRAYQALREQIATGGLAPGERITERGLALRLGVSHTIVREALSRLVQERLVERVSARHLRVAAHSAAALRELLYTEALVRAAGARFATPKISQAALDEMTGLVDELERDAATAEPAHLLGLARRFDELLVAAADNDVLAGMVDTMSVFGWTVRLRAVQAMRDRDPKIGRARIRQHRELLAALAARDAELVEALMRQHLIDAIDYILEQS